MKKCFNCKKEIHEAVAKHTNTDAKKIFFNLNKIKAEACFSDAFGSS